MTDLDAFGQRLSQERRKKAYLERRDILKKDVAKELGVAESTYGRWESGLTWPDESSLEKLAAYYSVTKAWLRYGVEARGAPLLPGMQEVHDPIADVVGKAKPRRHGRGR